MRPTIDKLVQFLIQLLKQRVMDITLYRYHDTGKATSGLLFIQNKFLCHTLEDTYRSVKVSGDTRIPDGRYEIKFREELSPKTKGYRARFDWFTWHLELQDVPDFKYVYVHVGNKNEDSEGCILVGNGSQLINKDETVVLDSTGAFRVFYLSVSKALRNKEKVFITITNISNA